jgi:glutathionyl-hydroquinone reductase
MSTKAQFPEEQSATGEFERQEDAFRDRVSTDGSTAYPAAAGRYHLYISLACPWASRTLIVRNLKGLQEAVGVTVVDPVRDERGWAFRDGPGYSRDPINGFHFSAKRMQRATLASMGASLFLCFGTSRRVGSRTTPRTISAGCSMMCSPRLEIAR